MYLKRPNFRIISILQTYQDMESVVELLDSKGILDVSTRRIRLGRHVRVINRDGFQSTIPHVLLCDYLTCRVHVITRWAMMIILDHISVRGRIIHASEVSARLIWILALTMGEHPLQRLGGDLEHYAFTGVAMASIKICATSGRLNSGGGSFPSFSNARTAVPLKLTRASGPCGQLFDEAIPPQAVQ